MTYQDSILTMPDEQVISLPLYYKENFFSNDPLYHPEVSRTHVGVAGDPVPYSMNNDNLVTGLLIACFLLTVFTFSRISGFITRQLKDFFYTPKGEHTILETGNEMRLQMVFVIQTSLIYGLLYYFYTTNFVTDTFIFSSGYVVLAIFAGIFLMYFTCKFGIYAMVNPVFFGNAANKKFLTSLLLITSVEGVLVFPILLLLAYFHFSAIYAIYYCAIAVILVKILTFYKSYIIFFKQKRYFLQIILYFCALEIVPLFALWGGLLSIVDLFKIKF